METLQSTIFIEFDVNTKKITFLRKDNIIDYDSNVTSVYVRVKYKDLSGNTTYLTPSELEGYEFSLYTIKPATNNVNEITGEVTDELKENAYGGVVKFEIPRKCTNRLGIVKCEIHINQWDKMIASSTFVLDVKQSLVTVFDDELLNDEDFPVLKQLILEIQKDSNIDDNNRSKITSYSSDKVENIKENLSSQIKEKATKNELDVERKRIDNFGSLKEGSTTGDAELIDIRIGSDGVIYKNAGTAVREQITKINNDIKNITPVSIKEKFDGHFMNYVVINNKLIYDECAISGIIDSVIGARYIIKAKRNNRFRIYGTNDISNKATVTTIYEATSVDNINGDLYEFINEVGYKYIIIYLYYSGTEITEYSGTLSCLEKIIYDNENFTVNGIQVSTPLDTNDLIDSLYVYGKNLFDKNKVILNSSISSITGEILELDGIIASDYIRVSPNTKYTLNARHTIAFYDKYKNYISGVSSSITEKTFETPNNCTYLRFSTKGDINIIQLEEGDIETHHENYEKYIDPDNIKVSKNNVTDLIVGKNLFNRNSELKLGKGLESSTGELVELSDYFTSDYINVKSNKDYYINSRRTIAFYDQNYTYISGVSSSITEKTFETPNNCTYLRFSAKEEDIDIIQLEEGVLPTEYEDYRQYYEYESKLFQEIIKPDSNVLSGISVLKDYSVSSTTGEIVENPSYYVTGEFVSIKANTTYTFLARHTIAFYDINHAYVSGLSSSDKTLTLTSPKNAKYMKLSWAGDYGKENIVCEGNKLIYEGMRIRKKYLPDNEYSLDFMNIKLPSENLGDKEYNLCLIAIKSIASEGMATDYTGYLYLNKYTQKLYYSSVTPDNPKYLCDWNTTLSGGEDCQKYMATITADGDIIFLRNWVRKNPIVYPHNDYNNPYIVDFGADIPPYGFLVNASIVQFDDGTFIFGDYTQHKLTDEQNNDPRNIWRVTKPYNDKTSWSVAHRFKHVYYRSPVSDEPDNEIGHIHTMVYDWYSNRMYCSTGDIDRHCRVWESVDKGLTWHEVASDGQKWRALGMIFTEDAVYWGTDSFYKQHNLYRCDRDENGVIDFGTLTKVCSLEPSDSDTQSQATYVNILLRNPNGILFLDRAEPRTDGMLDLYFYSFDDEKLHKCATLYRSAGEVSNAVGETRAGLPNQCATLYQPQSLDYVLCGGGDLIRSNNTTLFDNSLENYVGALKLKVNEIGMKK